MSKIPMAPIGKIIKEAGAERVSGDAKEALNAYTAEKAEAIAKKAVQFCGMAKRKTVKAEDIELAIKDL